MVAKNKVGYKKIKWIKVQKIKWSQVTTHSKKDNSAKNRKLMTLQ